MKLLLDTHIWVWSALERARLSTRLLAVLENPRNELWLSPISLWEVLTLCQKNRLTLHLQFALFDYGVTHDRCDPSTLSLIV